jgi:O-antigen/teichoic acid export membrane protein
MELKILLSNTYHLASAKLVRLVIGLGRAKLNAIFLGTTGLGIVSQILFINGRFAQFTLLGMNDGLVKQLASRKNDEDFRDQMLSCIKSYLIIISITTFLIVGISLVFSNELVIYFFGDKKYYLYYLISVVCLPIVIINSVSFALLKTFKLIDKMAKAELISTIVSVVLFIPMIYYFKLNGAIIAIVLNLSIILVFNYLFSKKYALTKYSISYWEAITKGKIVSADIKELAVFGGYGLTLGIYSMFVIIIKRSLLIDHFGLNSLGLYAPIVAWGGLYTGLMLPTIRHYLYPRFTELKSNIQIVGVINDAFRLTTFFMIPFLFGGIVLRKLVIPLFYSVDFLDAANYLSGHFIGMLFFMWSQIFVMVYTPTGRLKVFAIFQFTLQTINLGLVFYLIPKFGLYGYMTTFIIEPLLFIITSYIYLHKVIGFSFKKSNMKIMIYLMVSSLILLGISEVNSVASYITCVMFTVICCYFLRMSERSQIIKKIRSLSVFGNKPQ